MVAGSIPAGPTMPAQVTTQPPTPAISRDRLGELLVAVIGDAMLDVYLRGDVERISPEAPVPVVHVRERTHALGGAANVAHNVAALGARCELVAAIGNDP